MTKRKIIYFILSIISVLFYILFVGELSFYLMVFVVLLPAFLAAVLLIGKFSIKCSIDIKYKTAFKNSNCQFFLTVSNKSIFPFPTSIIKIEYKNKLCQTVNNMYISVPIHPRVTQTVNFSLCSNCCGIMNVKIASVRLFDYIKLFSCRAKVMKETDVYIIPEISSKILDHRLKNIFADDSEKFSKFKSGDDPSEIFDLKDYQPGDKLSRIHWNLSTKQNQLITKHYSQCISSPIAIIPDIDFNVTSLSEIDSALEIFYGISFLLIENEIIHKIYRFPSSEEITVSDRETLNKCYIDILKYAQDTGITTDKIYRISERQSELYVITNKDFNSYKISEASLNGKINYIFVNEAFENEDFIRSDSINISKLPVNSASDRLNRIL